MSKLPIAIMCAVMLAAGLGFFFGMLLVPWLLAAGSVLGTVALTYGAYTAYDDPVARGSLYAMSLAITVFWAVSIPTTAAAIGEVPEHLWETAFGEIGAQTPDEAFSRMISRWIAALCAVPIGLLGSVFVWRKSRQAL